MRRAETWDLFEIKGTNSKKEGNEDRDHISDLTFQKHVLELAGVTVDRANIVHLNKKYVRAGDLDVQALFTVSDSTDQVVALSAACLKKCMPRGNISTKRVSPTSDVTAI
jgi:hypothetical protein